MPCPFITSILAANSLDSERTLPRGPSEFLRCRYLRHPSMHCNHTTRITALSSTTRLVCLRRCDFPVQSRRCRFTIHQSGQSTEYITTRARESCPRRQADWPGHRRVRQPQVAAGEPGRVPSCGSVMGSHGRLRRISPDRPHVGGTHNFCHAQHLRELCQLQRDFCRKKREQKTSRLHM